MATSEKAVDENAFSSTARKTLIVDKDGNAITSANPLPTSAKITGDVNVDIDEINAEMKVDSGQDLYVAENIVCDGTWTLTFDAITGLSLKDIQGIENKTTGETYNTAGAAVNNTSVVLVSGNNTGKTAPALNDVVEIVYRGVSRLDTINTNLSAIKNTDGIKKIVDNVNIGDLSAGTQTNDVKITLDNEEVTVNATDLDIRDLSSTTDSVSIEGGNTSDVKVTLDSETVEVVQSTAGNLNVTEANSNSIKTSVELIDDAVGTIDSAFSGKVLVTGAKAESSVPTEVSDADAVAPWFDTFGRQVISGANLGLNAIDVNEVSPALLQSFDFLALDAVTATGASNVVNCLNYSKLTFYIVASSVSSGATVKVQSSPDNVSWYDENSSAIGTNGVTKVSITDEKLKYVRVNIDAYTDGTYSVFFIGGN